jgi:hypothetical protein
MNLEWLTWSNPVSIWWGFLLVVSTANIALWFLLKKCLLRHAAQLELMVFASAIYVFGCAFRSIFPRADVQRICLFDTWLSSVALGRSVATIALPNSALWFSGQSWSVTSRRQRKWIRFVRSHKPLCRSSSLPNAARGMQ